MRTLAMIAVFALAAFGQRHKLDEVDAGKPEGQLLQQCLQENDPIKKAGLMEQFVGQYPKTPQTVWVLEQLQQYYAKAGQAEQAMAAGEKLLALDPEDPEAALQCLKAAEAEKNVALIEKYSELTFANARKDAAAPQPQDADKVEDWKREVDYAKQVAIYADYALFRAAAETRDPKLTIELAEMLQKRSPDSEYVPKMNDVLFLAYRQTGANDKALALAEKVLANQQTNADMLLVVANSYLEQKKNPEKVHAYAAKAAEILAAEAQAPPMERGLAYYLNGKQYANENQFGPADEQLRKALPLVETNAGLKAEVLFLLGLANYKLANGAPARAQESANYFRACAALKSPYQATAAQNLARIQKEYRGIK
ncbi:MAG TPA: hypothetical protein VKX45_17320 [Bryobacteraceae bacterium]|jgi:tetratricopeptide (TPR) repeat protein|nr:hypothetical protein [Bryobacteraceae bacterium]